VAAARPAVDLNRWIVLARRSPWRRPG